MRKADLLVSKGLNNSQVLLKMGKLVLHLMESQNCKSMNLHQDQHRKNHTSRMHSCKTKVMQDSETAENYLSGQAHCSNTLQYKLPVCRKAFQVACSNLQSSSSNPCTQRVV